MPRRFVALSLCLLSMPAVFAASNFRTASTLQIAYEGAMLSFGLADFVGDGSKTLLASGFPWPVLDENKTLPIKAIKISRSGVLSDITATLIDGSPAQSWGRRGVVADFNGDGRADFFSASHGYDFYPFPGDYQALLMSQPNGKLKDESGGLSPYVRLFVHSAAAADLRRTGQPDIFVGVLNSRKIDGLDPIYTPADLPQSGWLGAFLLRNDGSGHFTFDNRTLPDKVTFSYNTGSNPWVSWDSPGSIVSSAFADLNGDGYPDLILGGDGDQNYAGAVYFNDGQGGFRTAEYKLPAGLFGAKNTITVDVLPFDVDGDGKVDLVLSQTPNSPYYIGSNLQILINKGNGTLADETAARLPDQAGRYPPGQAGSDHWVEFLKAVDLDGDGIKDLFLEVSYPSTGQVIAYRNDGHGNFAPLSADYLPPTQGYPWLMPVDFNGDGKTDFISVNNNTTAKQTTFTVFENVNSQLPAPTDSDRVFNYMEYLYPHYTSPLEVGRGTISGYYYRHYANSYAYLATAQDPKTNVTTLYYLGPASGNNIYSLGALTEWLTKAANAGY